MPRQINIEKFRRIAKRAQRCVWTTREEAVALMGDEGEGRYIEHASPARILRLLEELESLRARVADLEAQRQKAG